MFEFQKVLLACFLLWTQGQGRDNNFTFNFHPLSKGGVLWWLGSHYELGLYISHTINDNQFTKIWFVFVKDQFNSVCHHCNQCFFWQNFVTCQQKKKGLWIHQRIITLSRMFPFWPNYVGENMTTLCKGNWIKMWCYWEHWGMVKPHT
jgi:hypothetical protein